MERTIPNKPVMIFIPYALLAAALVSVFLTFAGRVELKPFEVEYPAESFISPHFELPSLHGSKVQLSDYRGKVVFINFWATWCATCEVEMPSMQKLYDRFKGDHFEMLTISVDKDQSKIRPF
ncbi:MAG: redoxin domain-containing protein, partial [Nitrospinaceae bacterium]